MPGQALGRDDLGLPLRLVPEPGGDLKGKFLSCAPPRSTRLLYIKLDIVLRQVQLCALQSVVIELISRGMRNATKSLFTPIRSTVHTWLFRTPRSPVSNVKTSYSYSVMMRPDYVSVF